VPGGQQPGTAQFGTPAEDVSQSARNYELRKLFVRSGNRGELMPKSGRQAQLELMAMRPEAAHKPPVKPRSGRQALVEVVAVRWPQPLSKTAAERRAELTRMRLAPYETAEMARLHE